MKTADRSPGSPEVTHVPAAERHSVLSGAAVAAAGVQGFVCDMSVSQQAVGSHDTAAHALDCMWGGGVRAHQSEQSISRSTASAGAEQRQRGTHPARRPARPVQ